MIFVSKVSVDLCKIIFIILSKFSFIKSLLWVFIRKKCGILSSNIYRNKHLFFSFLTSYHSLLFNRFPTLNYTYIAGETLLNHGYYYYSLLFCLNTSGFDKFQQFISDFFITIFEDELHNLISWGHRCWWLIEFTSENYWFWYL